MRSIISLPIIIVQVCELGTLETEKRDFKMTNVVNNASPPDLNHALCSTHGQAYFDKQNNYKQHYFEGRVLYLSKLKYCIPFLAGKNC